MDTKTEPKMELRLTRADFIDQVVTQGRREAEGQLKVALEETKKAARAFVDAVKVDALRIAKPVVEAANKVRRSTSTAYAHFSYRIEFSDEELKRERLARMMSSVEFEGTEPKETFSVEVNFKNERYGDNGFSIWLSVPLTRELHRLRMAAMNAASAEHELRHRYRNYQQAKGEITRKMLAQAIDELPGGKKLLKALNDLRRRSDETQKPLQLAESQPSQP
jgi:hypothetical protein